MAGKKDDQGYTLTLSGPDHTFKRQVGDDIATKIITFVMSGAELSKGSGGGHSGGSDPKTEAPDASRMPASGGQLTPKQFIAQKRPGSNYERVACLAYYLANYRETQHFKTSDINQLNTESAHHFTNAALFVRHATNTYRYLSSAGGGKKQITILGEAVVEALPDRAKVAEAIAEHKPARKKKAKRKKAK
jgi:hypothetical protein